MYVPHETVARTLRRRSNAVVTVACAAPSEKWWLWISGTWRSWVGSGSEHETDIMLKSRSRSFGRELMM